MDVTCGGNEENIKQCHFGTGIFTKRAETAKCADDIASVECSRPFRLAHQWKDVEYKSVHLALSDYARFKIELVGGLPKMMRNGEWGTICVKDPICEMMMEN